MANSMQRPTNRKVATTVRETQTNPTSEGDRKVTFRADSELYKQLRHITIAEGSSVTQVLNDAIETYVEAHEKSRKTTTPTVAVKITKQTSRQVTFRTDDELYRKLRLITVEQDTTVTHILHSAIEAYVAGKSDQT